MSEAPRDGTLVLTIGDIPERWGYSEKQEGVVTISWFSRLDNRWHSQLDIPYSTYLQKGWMPLPVHRKKGKWNEHLRD